MKVPKRGENRKALIVIAVNTKSITSCKGLLSTSQLLYLKIRPRKIPKPQSKHTIGMTIGFKTL